MRKHKLDNRRVVCPRAELLAGGTRILKHGMFFTFQYEDGSQRFLARSLGHVTAGPDGDASAFDGIMAMVLSEDASFVFIRWVSPEQVTRIDENPPHKLAAFFFAPTLPYSSATIVRLIDYGTVCERFIEGAAVRVANWEGVTHDTP